jgi:hypothetical protein
MFSTMLGTGLTTKPSGCGNHRNLTSWQINHRCYGPLQRLERLQRLRSHYPKYAKTPELAPLHELQRLGSISMPIGSFFHSRLPDTAPRGHCSDELRTTVASSLHRGRISFAQSSRAELECRWYGRRQPAQVQALVPYSFRRASPRVFSILYEAVQNEPVRPRRGLQQARPSQLIDAKARSMIVQ